jgi:hypothetical protein
MSQDLTKLVNNQNGLIFLADVAWHRSSGKHADMACTFRRRGGLDDARDDRGMDAGSAWAAKPG